MALSSSVHGRGLVNGDREREGLQGKGCLSVVEILDFLGRLVLVGGSTRRGEVCKFEGRGLYGLLLELEDAELDWEISRLVPDVGVVGQLQSEIAPPLLQCESVSTESGRAGS